MEITLNNMAISRLTGAPLSALEKKGIKEYKSQAVRNGEDVFIEGAIVDSSSFLAGYEGFFSPQNLRERLEETSGDINLFIDSPGGSVFAASNMLTQVMKVRNEGRKVNVVVSGLAASAATYFLLEADNSLIAPMGMVMIHRAWTMTTGNAEVLAKVVEILEKMDAQYVQKIAGLTGKEAGDVESAVSDETWFTGEEAVDYGLVGGLYTSPEPAGEGDEDGEPSNKFRMLIHQLSDFNF